VTRNSQLACYPTAVPTSNASPSRWGL